MRQLTSNDAPQGGSAQEANARRSGSNQWRAGSRGKPGRGSSVVVEKTRYAGPRDRYTERQSDMLGLGPDGKPVPGYKATGIGVTPATTAYDPSKPQHKMKLTQEEQDILDGKKGKALAKVMRTIVDHGNLFGATKLVKLGGAPHTSFFTGTPAMAPLVEAFAECADEGLKAYAPYTINPRPFEPLQHPDLTEEQNMIFEGYPLQTEIDHLHCAARRAESRYTQLHVLPA